MLDPYGSRKYTPFSKPSSHKVGLIQIMESFGQHSFVHAYTLGLDHGAAELPTASGMQKDSGAGVLPGIPGWLVVGSS